MAIFGKKKDKQGSGQQDAGNNNNNNTTNNLGTPPSGDVSNFVSIGNGSLSRSPPVGSSSRDGHGIAQPQPGMPPPGMISHGQKSSLSGSGGAAGVGSGFGPTNGMPGQPAGILRNTGVPPQAQGMMMQGSQQDVGPPGAAGGFKFGGPAPRPDAAGSSGIPTPGGQMRGSNIGSKKMSNEADSNQPYRSSAAGIPGHVGGIPASGSGIAGLPPSSAQGPPLQQQGSADRPRAQQVVYPWSQRTLTMNPPRFLDETRQTPAGTLSPSPFPRYGHAANGAASTSGEVYLFGGLVRESVKNDLYTVHVDKILQPLAPAQPGMAPQPGGINATLVQTTGEIPPPRVGHATVLVANVLILWGGDTKVRADDKQDEGLYLLNLSTREWTRVRHNSEVPNAGPVGRYGHTVSIVGSRFFVFGGQVDGTFMNDLWTFDLNSLKSTPTWTLLKPQSEMPPKRTGHASVTYKDRIFIFGGTDGQYHYNDTWCYDVATNTWKELSCIGYIPVPREGHAACLVEDVMYIFGGRGVDGKDLGDLASFRISNQRWYMFANMGPSPSGRSGHALTTYQNKVVVLGGESFTGAKADDPSFVHVLDTGKIKYPPEGGSKSPPSVGRKSGIPGPGAEGARSMSPSERATSPSQRNINGTSGSQPESLVGLMQKPGPAVDQQQQGSLPTAQPQSGLPPGQPADAPTASKMVRPAGGSSGPEPGAANRSISPITNSRSIPPAAGGSALMMAGAPSQQSMASSTSQQGPGQVQPGARSMANPAGPASVPISYTGPKSQRSLENMRNGATSPPGGMPFRGVNGIVGAPAGPGAASMGYPSDRSNAVVSPTAQEGFHYGNQPNGVPRGMPGLQSTTSPVEVDMLRRREAWMKAALAMAVKKGFILPDQLDAAETTAVGGPTRSLSRQAAAPDFTLDDIDTGVQGSDKERVMRAIISLKSQLASAKSMIAQQATGEAERAAEGERARSAALSEAAFYRAKLEALEHGNTSEADQLQRSRNAEMEKQLSATLRECGDLERQLSRARDETKLEQQLRQSAESRLSETSKRAVTAEESQMGLHEQLAALQKGNYQSESQLRDHKEKVASLATLVATHQGNHAEAQRQLEEHKDSSAKHQAALKGMQSSLAAMTARAAEHEHLHHQHRELVQQHEMTIANLRHELESKSLEAGHHSSRATELESLVSRHRDEAETHKLAVNTGLSQLLAFHQQQESRGRSVDGDDLPLHVQEQMRALQDERETLRLLHSQSKETADSTNILLQEMRERNFGLEKQQGGLKSELAAMRGQLSIAMQEVARLKDHSSGREVALRDAQRSIESNQVKHSLMRQMMVDRGMALPSDEDLSSSKDNATATKIRELENQIDERGRELQETEERLRDASSRVEELTRELEHGKTVSKDGNGPVDSATNEKLTAAHQRAEEAERQAEETSNSYKERMSQLENDYQTAVQFVKGSEKMLRRMKDELTKYKTENTSLQSEVVSLRSGQSAPVSDNEAARDIDALRTRLADLTHENESVGKENRELEKKMSALISEHRDARDKSRESMSSALGGQSSEGARRAKELEVQVAQLEGSLNDVRKELQDTLALNTHLNNQLTSASKSSKGPDVEGEKGSNESIAKDLSNAQHQNEQLREEKESLGQKLQDAEDKLQLLLGRMEGNESEANLGRDSHTYSISSELDKWERDRATEGAVYGTA